MSKKVVCSLLSFLILSACTKPGVTTGISAAAGATVGAGIGAIIGSQTGNAGGGLVIGAALGSAGGAAAGNAVEFQNERFEEQNALILKQQQELKKNQRMLEDLKRIRKADGDVRAGLSPRLNIPKRVDVPVIAPVPSSVSKQSTKELSFTPPVSLPAKAKEKVISEKSLTIEEPIAQTAKIEVPENQARFASSDKNTALVIDSAECKKASEEVAQAEQASDLADRLFRYRRALRLCPQHAGYHVKLGEVYQKLGRVEDSHYEFKEALKLDPSNSTATALLQQPQTKKADRY